MGRQQHGKSYTSTNNNNANNISAKRIWIPKGDIAPYKSSSSQQQHWKHITEERKADNDLFANCLRTPCYLEGEKVIGFVDVGASTSFIDKRSVEERKLSITPRKGHIVQVTNGGQQPRIGVVEGLTLEMELELSKLILRSQS